MPDIMPDIMSTPSPNSVVDELRQRIQRLAGAPSHGREILPFGIDVIDRVLPGGGLTLGALHEVAGRGNGAIDCATGGLFTARIGAGNTREGLGGGTRQDP